MSESIAIKKLKDFKERRHFSQGSIAKLIGVESATVYRWLAGTMEPSQKHQDKILRVIKQFDDIFDQHKDELKEMARQQLIEKGIFHKDGTLTEKGELEQRKLLREKGNVRQIIKDKAGIKD